MIPILARIGPLDFGHGLLVALAVFLLMLSWRRAARALGEKVPPLTSVGVLASFCTAAVVAAVAVLLVNRFGPIEIRAYGLMLVIGFSAATAWCIHAGRSHGYGPAIFLDLVLYVLLGAIVGARLAYVLMDWQAYVGHVGETLALWQGGLSFHGGVAGGILAGALYTWRTKQSFLRLCDIVAPGIALGYAFGRVGCFLNGCCYGRPTSLPWGVVFPHATWIDGRPLTDAVHPTQLYGSVASLVIFAVLLWSAKHLRRPGHLMALYLLLYSVYRFLIEYLRRDATAVPVLFMPSLTVGQLVSLIVGVLALSIILVTWPRGGKGIGR